MNYLSESEQQANIQKIGAYILSLMPDGKLKSIQPLEMNGYKLWHKPNVFLDCSFSKLNKC